MFSSWWQTSTSCLRFIAGDSRWRSFEKVSFVILKRSRGEFVHDLIDFTAEVLYIELLSVSFRTPALWLFVPSLIPSILYSTSIFTPRPALLTNVLGVSFAHSALSLFKLDTFRTGCILLSGLFVYDVWWVFGTKVVRFFRVSTF